VLNGPSILLQDAAHFPEWAQYFPLEVVPMVLNGPRNVSGGAAYFLEWAQPWSSEELPIALNGPVQFCSRNLFASDL
jgi:hypothetical protein